jgi:hypothetical protein
LIWFLWLESINKWDAISSDNIFNAFYTQTYAFAQTYAILNSILALLTNIAFVGLAININIVIIGFLIMLGCWQL